MDRRKFLVLTTLGGGAALAGALPGIAASTTGLALADLASGPEPASGLDAAAARKGVGGGISSTRLRRMHEVMAGHVESGGVPGRDTIFRIASVTKPITAAAAMILVEECRFVWTSPVPPPVHVDFWTSAYQAIND